MHSTMYYYYCVLILAIMVIIIIILNSGCAEMQIPPGGAAVARLPLAETITDRRVTGEGSGLWRRPAASLLGVRGDGSEDSGTPMVVPPQQQARATETATGKASTCSLRSRVGGTSA